MKLSEVNPPCEPCAEFRRGDRENLKRLGFTIHVCERKRDGQWGLDACPCGCADREPGVIDTDKILYGNVFLTARGARVDPQIVTGFWGAEK